MIPRHTSRCRNAGILALAMTVATLPVARAQDEVAFIAAFVDANGAAVTDVTAAEVAVVENGVRGTVVRVEPFERALDITLIVDNGIGLGPALAEFRTGARGFFAAVPVDAQLSLVTIAPQPRWLMRPDTGRQNAIRAVDRLTPDESLGRFLDALVEAGGRLRDQSRNHIPVIVVVASTNPDGSSSRERDFNRLAQQVSEHGATVHAAILSTTARLVGGRMPGGVVSDAQHIIGFELAKLTGGRYEQIAVSSRLATLLPELGARIAAESPRYRVTVRRPETAKGPIGSVGFAIARPGVSIKASFAPPRR